jgi:hypothetical protein
MLNKITMNYEGQLFTTGDKITCIIDKTKITDGKIYIFSKPTTDSCCYDDCDFDSGQRYFYICNNQRKGMRNIDCGDNLGYKYCYDAIYQGLGTFDSKIIDLKLYKELYVNPSYHPVPLKDNLAILVDNFITIEQKEFYKAIGE